MRVASLPPHPLARGTVIGLTLALCSGMALAAADPIQKSGFRVYRERNAQGEEVLHVTNLDESGRRIGGEIEPTVPAGGPVTQCLDEQESAPVPSIIINVYTSGQPEQILDGYDQDESWYPNYGYARFPATLWPHRARPHRNAGPQEGLFGRPRAIDTRPYTRGTAAQRNRATFHRN